MSLAGKKETCFFNQIIRISFAIRKPWGSVNSEFNTDQDTTLIVTKNKFGNIVYQTIKVNAKAVNSTLLLKLRMRNQLNFVEAGKYILD